MHAHGDAVRDGSSPVASTKALLMQRAACQEVRGHAPRRRLGEGGAVLQAEVDGALAAGRQVERQVQARGPGVRLAGGRPQRCMSGPAELKSVHNSSSIMPQLDPHYARVQGCQSHGVTGSRLHVCSSSYRKDKLEGSSSYAALGSRGRTPNASAASCISVGLSWPAPRNARAVWYMGNVCARSSTPSALARAGSGALPAARASAAAASTARSSCLKDCPPAHDVPSLSHAHKSVCMLRRHALHQAYCGR